MVKGDSSEAVLIKMCSVWKRIRWRITVTRSVTQGMPMNMLTFMMIVLSMIVTAQGIRMVGEQHVLMVQHLSQVNPALLLLGSAVPTDMGQRQSLLT